MTGLDVLNEIVHDLTLKRVAVIASRDGACDHFNKAHVLHLASSVVHDAHQALFHLMIEQMRARALGN